MKKIITSLIGILFFVSVAHGFSSVFDTSSTPSIELLRNLNTSIIPGTPQLSSTVLVFKTKKWVKVSDITGSCPVSLANLYENTAGDTFDLQVIEVWFPSGSCHQEDFQAKTTDDSLASTPLMIPLFESTKKYEQLLDKSNSVLDYIVQNNLSKIDKLTDKISLLKAKNLAIAKLQTIEYAYQKQYLRYENSLISEIIQWRKSLRYLVPVSGKTMPTNPSFIPNAGRPYRADTTDGIHHGWDLMAPIGTPVRSVAPGIVIRIVNDFSWGKFDSLKKEKPLSITAKAENLDIFRGNQVWLKMLDGNVVFYSHLSAIAPGLYVGKKVSAGEVFGNIGISGVPDKDYNNPHLHFEIAENPLTPKATPAELHDMLLWQYLGSNLSRKSVLSLQNSLFYNELFAKK